MKTIRTIKLIVALVIVIGASKSVAVAGDSLNYETNFKVWNVEEETYRLIYRNDNEKFVKIRFVDENNQVLYKARVKSEFVKTFDLSLLPFGKYTFQVEAAGEWTTEEVTISSPEDKYESMIDVTDLNNQGVLQVSIDEQADTSFDLYIIDADGESLYQEEVVSGKKLYDLSQIKSEHVRLILFKDHEVVKSADIKL